MRKFRLFFVALALMIRFINFMLMPVPTPENTVANYVQKYSNTQLVTALKEECTEKGMNLSVRSRGTTVVWEYRIIEKIKGGPFVEEKLKRQLKAYVNAAETQQQDFLADVKAECPFVTSMKQEFYDVNGILLASGEVK